jgi:short-subunit dehydrogenase
MNEEKPGIWITGASSGIGRAAVKEFVRVGAKVFASARRNTELERLKTELKKEKLNVELFPCNVASSANVDQTVKKIIQKNQIDCLINSAGITSFKPAEENSIPEIDNIINTNLLGSIYAIKFVLPFMIKSRTIINVLSSAAKNFINSTAYTIEDSRYSDVLREEVRKYNIKVINVIPGATETPMWPPEVRNEKSERMMSAEDLARVLVWLYLQKGNLVTEEVLVKPITGDL